MIHRMAPDKEGNGSKYQEGCSLKSLYYSGPQPLDTGTGFMEDNFPMGRGGEGGLGMILVRSIQPRSLLCAAHSRVPTPMRT